MNQDSSNQNIQDFDQNEFQINNPESSRNSRDKHVTKSRSGRKIFLAIAILVIVIVALLVWFFILRKPKSSDVIEVVSDNVNTEEYQEEPTPTVIEQKSDKKDLKIEILNASGVSGEASYLKSELQKLGYENFTTGNADDQGMSDTKIYYAPDIDDLVREELDDKLNGIYKKVTSGELSSLDEGSIRIQVGLRKTQTLPSPTSAVSATKTPTPSVSVTPKPSSTPSPTPTP